MSKNFLITGSARGIGRGLTRLLLAKGHRVVLVDNNKTELDHMSTTVLPSITSDTSQYKTCLTDLTQPEQITASVSEASNFFSNHIDVLINNAFAGPVGQTPFNDLSLTEWSRTITTNLTGSMLMSQACLPYLRRSSSRQSGGSIIMMSSTRAEQSESNSEAYATTKAGLIGLTHALACSLAGDNISVNAILPGWINVMNESKEADENGIKWEDGLSEEDMKWHWTGRVGRVNDVLKAVEYLVDAKDFVTGTEMVVDGGVTRKMVYPE